MNKRTIKILLNVLIIVAILGLGMVYAGPNIYDDTYVGKDFCSEKGTIAAINVVAWIIMIAKIAIPFIIIFFGTFDIVKMVIDGDTSTMSKKLKSLGLRVVLGVFIFFLPAITKGVLGYLLPEDYNNCAKCFFKPGTCDGNIMDPIDNKASTK